eukprot:scaffold34474_cov117-Isochrysis_galbana.AAC.1
MVSAASPEPVGPGSVLHHYLRACELGVSSGAQVRAERARTMAAEHTGSSHRTQATLSRPACSKTAPFSSIAHPGLRHRHAHLPRASR